MSIQKNSDHKTIYNLYHNRNFYDLSKMNLGTLLDDARNTILHVMAKSCDQDAFEEIIKFNPMAINNENINLQNINGNTPILLAYFSIRNSNIGDYNFLEYLIDNFEVDMSIRNNNDEVLERKYKTKSTAILDAMKQIAQQDKIYNKSAECATSAHIIMPNESHSISDESKLMFIDKLINYYIPNSQMTGGKHHDYDDDDDDDDSEYDFEEYRKKNDFEKLFDMNRHRFEKDKIEIFNSLLDKLKDKYDLNDEDARFYRTALKLYVIRKNPELRKYENEGIKLKEMQDIIEDKERGKKVLFEEINKEEIQKEMAKRKENYEKYHAHTQSDDNNTSDEVEKPIEKKSSKSKKEPKDDVEKPKKTKKSSGGSKGKRYGYHNFEYQPDSEVISSEQDF